MTLPAHDHGDCRDIAKDENEEGPECEKGVTEDITIYEERIIVFYGRAIPAIRVTLSVKPL